MNTTQYLTGARPVVGTLGAAGLMLLACSWFVLGPGELGRSRDVGTPAPVRIHATVRTPQTTATPSPARRDPVAHTRAVSVRPDVSAKANAAPATRTPTTAFAPSQPSSTPPAAPSHAAAPTTPGVPAPQPAPELPAVTPTLPAPVDDIPPASLPPASVPQLPPVQVPDVSATATQLGLP